MQAQDNDLDLATNDLGPLAWVLDELRKSLESASSALRRFVRDAGAARGTDMASVDAGQLRIARQQLHQSVGALEMVGMQAPACMLRAMESAVQKFVERPELCSEAASAKVERAGFALAEYLEGVLLGKSTTSVALFPQYRDVQELAAAERVHPADLWALDWRWVEPQTPAVAEAYTYDPALRSRLDQAVLRVVKTGDAQAAQDLSHACLALASTQQARQPKIFWKICAGFFEAIRLNLLPLDIYVKRAGSRVLMQYASLAKGELSVSDRLAQDLLFFCAQALPAHPADAPALASVRLAYRLNRFPTVDYQTPQFGRFDPLLLSQARKRIGVAKETWSALSGGDANKLKGVAEQFSPVCDSLTKLHPPSGALSLSLARAIEAVVRSGQPPRTEVAMEVATAVLYLEAAFQDLDPTDSQLARRTLHLAQRLDRVREGGQPEPLESWMEDLYRRVSDRQTMGSVVGELRSTLSELEKVLDAFFRNPQDKTPIQHAPGHLTQMRGVLSVLGLDQAAQAVLRMRESLDKMLLGDLDEEGARASDAFDKLGNNLGALGFLIDMLNYQPALAKKLFVYDDARGELRPLMGRTAGAPGAADTARDAEPAVDDVPPSADVFVAATVPSPVEPLPAVAPAAVAAEAAPTAVRAWAAAAVRAPDAVQLPVEVPVPVAAPVPQEDSEADELLGIFLEEAREVVQTGLAAIEALAANPADASELTTLRRAFHTLKGSSRMVGLNEFGEAGWSMEQVLNTWLADQKPATDELRALAAAAMHGFARWVEAIAQHGGQAWNSSMFREPADALRNEGRLLPLNLPAPAEASALFEPQAFSAAEPRAAEVGAMAEAAAPAHPAGGAEDSLIAASAFTFDAPERVEAAADAPMAFDFDFDLPLTLQANPTVEVLPPTFADGPAELDLSLNADPDLTDPGAAFELPIDTTVATPQNPGVTEPAFAMPDFDLDLSAPAPLLAEPTADAMVVEAAGDAELMALFDAPQQQDRYSPEVEAALAPSARDDIDLSLDLTSSSAAMEDVLSLDGSRAIERQPTADAEPAGDVAFAAPDALEFAPVVGHVPAAEIAAPQAELQRDALQDLGFALATVTAVSPEFTSAPVVFSDAPSHQDAQPQAETVVPASIELPGIVELSTAPGTQLLDEPPFEFASPVDAADAMPAIAGADEQIKVIGTLRIGIPLYNVYLNEADEWSRRLVTEVGEWALELNRQVPDSAVGLAHALAGSSATVGFHALSEIARALEHSLESTQPLAFGTPQHGQAFVAAAEEIRRLLHQFAAGFLKEPDPRVVRALDALQGLNIPQRADLPESDPFGLDDPVTAPAVDMQGTVAGSSSVVMAEPAPASASTEAFAAQPTWTAPEVAATAALQHVPAFGAARSPEAIAEAAAQPAAKLATERHTNEDEDDIDVVDAVDADLFPIFEEEAVELLPQLGSALRQWAEHPEQRSARDQVLRALHTLKGSARLAGALRLGEMAHRIESEIEALGSANENAADIEPLLHRFDNLQSSFDGLRARIDGTESAAEETPFTAAQAQPLAPEVLDQPMLGTEPWPQPASTPTRAVLARPVTTLMAPQRAAANQAVRVRAQLLDRLVNQAGEVMITRSRLEAELRQLRSSLTDLTGNLDRLRTQLRDIELHSETQMQSRLAQAKDSAAGFDPLEFDRFTRVQELTRMMAESVNDVATVQRNLQRTVEATEDDLVAQARQTRELQRDLLRTRMVEFEGISDRLYRVVRLASKETGKQVKLDITGGSIEMDRGVLDRMTPAFEHLLRNCVAHGIEEPQARLARGKDAAGTILIGLNQEGNDVSVEFRDDGAGLNLARIREKAVQQGLVAADQELSAAEAANLIFMPGFSTATHVTELAGRGIGMDVVRAEVNALGGRIETNTEAGRGTSFKLVLPLTTAVTQVVMIRSGALAIGVPANLVEIVRRAPAREVEQAYNSGSYEFGGEQLPFYWSGALLQASQRSTEAQGKTLPVVIFRSAAQRIAVHVDEVLGNQEVVVKNLGPQLARLPGLAGMTMLASGAVVLIYNPVALTAVYGEQAKRLSADHAQPEVLEHNAVAASAGQPAGPVASIVPAAPQVPLVLVVDDSITVRRVTQRLLQREGYRVSLAADGLQALERLAEELPAVVLSDIEMPRMDGFDLARNIRGDVRLKSLPIVMITSRIAEKHREHAKELGVNHYLGKPYSEEELLSLVKHYGSVALATA